MKSSQASFFSLRCMFNKSVALPGLLALLIVTSANADETADVSKLMRAGQHAEALAKANAFLAQRPRDAQMRFLKGVILTEQNKSAEAITVFTKLTEDYPDLPEPYNNLAVLYAADNQNDKARAALDKAIRTNPSYATAYENLGDIHAKLASQAYDKALQLDNSNSAAKSKLTMVRSLVPANSGTVMAKASVPPTVTKPVPAAPAPALAPAPVAAEKPKLAAAPAVKKEVPITIARMEPLKAQPMPAKPAAGNSENDAVLAVVSAWAKAWSAKDVKSYLSYYANNFDTPNGLSRKAWNDERQSRIAGKGRISVKIDSPQVTVKGDTATVKFRQTYISDRLSANSRKTLVLVKHGGRWQIQQERTG